MLKWLLAAVLLLAPSSAYAAFDTGDLICETTTTTGTGTVNLAGAVTNYVTFLSQITSGSTVHYHIRASDGKLETGTGTFTDATPDTLSRTAYWSSDGDGAELTLPAGTHTICMGPISHSQQINLLNRADDAVGTAINAYADSASPATSDDIITISGYGENSVGAQFEYARLFMEIGSPTNGSEVGSVAFAANGTNSSQFALQGSGYAEFAAQGSGPLSFYMYDFASAGVGSVFTIANYSNDPADNDLLNSIHFAGQNDGDFDEVNFAILNAYALDVTDDTEDGRLDVLVEINSTSTVVGRFDLSGFTVPTGNILLPTGYAQFTEIADPGGGAANTGRLYVRDNGGGKSQLIIVFNSGAAQVIATEP